MNKTPETFGDALEAIFDEARELAVRKQRDYGKDNILKFGAIGVMVRLSDKYERLLNLLRSEVPPANETLEDNAIDLVNYSAFLLMLLREWFQLPLDAELPFGGPDALEEATIPRGGIVVAPTIAVDELMDRIVKTSNRRSVRR